MSIFDGLVDWLDRCFVSSTPYGTLWVSTFILCHVFDVEVSEVQNCREVDLLNVFKV